MDWPLVSVIIPCYNASSCIKESINSVISQAYPNLEVIVVDDGSTDNSVEVLQSFGNKITLLTQENSGPAAARNLGIQAANGEYIAFNDSDDLWLPGKLSAQITYMQEHPEVGLCYCDWIVQNGESPVEAIKIGDREPAQSIEIDPNYTGCMYVKLLKDSIIHTITAVIRRDVLNDVGLFNTQYRIGEDHDLWLRIAYKYNIAKIKEAYAVYRINPESTTKKVHDQNYSLLVLQSALKKHGRECPSGQTVSKKEINQYLGTRHFSYGYNALINGHREKALLSFKGSFKHRYKIIKAMIFTAICSIPPLYSLFLRFKKNGRKL